jgi:hypothetical protein
MKSGSDQVDFALYQLLFKESTPSKAAALTACG